MQIDISMNGEHVETFTNPQVPMATNEGSTHSSHKQTEVTKGSHTYRLEDLAYTRSGDKGNNCNIGGCMKRWFKTHEIIEDSGVAEKGARSNV